VTTGEGGICLTDDDKLAEKMRILRDHGMNPSRRYWHESVGFNYRMTNMQAAIGAAQLDKLDKFVAKKREIALWYERGLSEMAGKGLIKLQPEMPWVKCVYWMYSILTGESFISRDELIGRLNEAGIETRPFFHPIHSLPMYRNDEIFPVAEGLSGSGLNLPSGTKLTEAEINSVVTAITEMNPES
jgi:perosamine synthetase